mmetsp:Transcript_6837/g.11018  ORF Transcript_6837/g.11018 Transcript_6837/m.11018 type:complete len:97 (+) Transcript_6837:454-744(+)
MAQRQGLALSACTHKLGATPERFSPKPGLRSFVSSSSSSNGTRLPERNYPPSAGWRKTWSGTRFGSRHTQPSACCQGSSGGPVGGKEVQFDGSRKL